MDHEPWPLPYSSSLSRCFCISKWTRKLYTPRPLLILRWGHGHWTPKSPPFLKNIRALDHLALVPHTALPFGEDWSFVSVMLSEPFPWRSLASHKWHSSNSSDFRPLKLLSADHFFRAWSWCFPIWNLSCSFCAMGSLSLASLNREPKPVTGFGKKISRRNISRSFELCSSSLLFSSWARANFSVSTLSRSWASARSFSSFILSSSFSFWGIESMSFWSFSFALSTFLS